MDAQCTVSKSNFCVCNGCLALVMLGQQSWAGASLGYRSRSSRSSGFQEGSEQAADDAGAVDRLEMTHVDNMALCSQDFVLNFVQQSTAKR